MKQHAQAQEQASMRSRSGGIRHVLRILAALAAMPLLRSLIKKLCRQRQRGRERADMEASGTGCASIPPALYRRPDPLIYDQFYLLAQGLAVTWDNPDVSIEHNGMPVSAHDLRPDTLYEVVARIWNGSTDAPVVGLPIHFSYLDFGVSTPKTAIGTTTVDLGVKGSQSSPAYARHPWRTPQSPGHYCLQIELDWQDDANPANNLGQHNTDVQALNSPDARSRFTVHNPGREPLTFTFRIDDYALPARSPCPDESEPAPEQTEEERERRLHEALATHGTDQFALPEGWRVTTEPRELRLEPGESRDVLVDASAPDGFAGRQPINIGSFVNDTLVGGVTIYVEGRA